jgi:hypothetical protein
MSNEKTYEIVSDNGFTKIFKLDDVDMFVQKAFDEDSNKYFLITSIPTIPSLGVEHIKFPIVFELKEEMEQGYEQTSVDWARKFLSDAIAYIEENREKAKIESN